MLRYLMIIVIFLGCTFIGFYIGENYKRRYIQLNELLKGILLLNNEVMYSQTALPEAFKNIAVKINEPISNLFFNMANDLNDVNCLNVYEAYKKNMDLESNKMALDEEDKKILEHFFKTLGESLAYGQDMIFNLTIENLKINCSRAEKITMQNTKMFRYVGICVGAIAVIFLI